MPSNKAPNIPCKVVPAPGGAIRYAYDVIFKDRENIILYLWKTITGLNTVDQYTPSVNPFNNSIGSVSQGFVKRE